MKIYQPLFSSIVILLQLILSIKDYNDFVSYCEDHPCGIITRYFLGDTLFLFVLILGIYEMLTPKGKFKKALRIFLVCIILGTQFGGYIPINSFFYGVYNTAWFCAIVAVFLILFKIGKYFFRNKTYNSLK